MSYTSRKKKEKEQKNKILAKYTVGTITNFIYYSLSTNDIITVNNLVNLKRLIDYVDIDKTYKIEEDLTTIQMLRLLKEILNFNIDYTVEDIEELKTTIKDKVDDNYIPHSLIDSLFEGAIEHEFDQKKIIYWNKFIQDQLDYISVFNYIPALKDLISAFEFPTPEDIENIIPVAKDMLISLNRKFNLNTMATDGKMNSFNITDRYNAKKIIKQSLENIYNPGNKIPTGYKLLDKMLGGWITRRTLLFIAWRCKEFQIRYYVKYSNECCY